MSKAFSPKRVDDMSYKVADCASSNAARRPRDGHKGVHMDHKDESRGKRSVEETNQFIRDGRYFNA